VAVLFFSFSSSSVFLLHGHGFLGADIAYVWTISCAKLVENVVVVLRDRFGKVLVEMVGVHVWLQKILIGKAPIFADEQVDSARMNASIPLLVLCL
jgi:hypothetical protein